MSKNIKNIKDNTFEINNNGGIHPNQAKKPNLTSKEIFSSTNIKSTNKSVK